MTNVSAMSERQQKAHAIGEILAANEEFVAEVSAQAKRKDESKVSAAQLALIAGEDLDAQQVMSIPDPGSDEDKYDTEEGEKRGSFTWDMASDLPDGKSVNQHLDWIKEARKTGVQYSPDNPFVGKNGKTLDAERAYWSGRKQSIKNVVADCVWLMKGLLLANGLGGVVADIRKGKDGHVLMSDRGNTPVVQCIVVADKTEMRDDKVLVKENFRYMSVGSFLALDVSKMKQDDIDDEAKQYKAFIATGNRKGKSGPGDSDTTKLEAEIKKPETAVGYMQALVAYYGDPDHGDKRLAALLKDMAKGLTAKDTKAGKVDMLVTLGDMCLIYDRVWSVVRDSYNAVKEKEAAAREAAETKAA